MLAILSGDICLLFGLTLLLLPLLATELSRPRDGAWGAVVLVLGLVLVTSNDRLRGAPMLAVLCGSLLIGRLSMEVGQARWRILSDDEQRKLGSLDHWLSNIWRLKSAAVSLGEALSSVVKQLKPTGKSGVTKKWVRPGFKPAEAPKATSKVQPVSSSADDGI
ncbi:Ycf66 family protein [Synechococcus sp. M16CYN]|uniref:Ycf66 family protein n=1 Tax=Synechococcus sp. M16CYN TaxID=3103139 RepID=UPI0032471F81